MKKRIYQLLALLCLTCLWGCLSGFTSGSQSTVSFLYECGEWAGKTCGSYEGELSGEKPSGAGTLTFTYGGTYTGDFKDSHPSGTGTYTFASGKSASGSFSWSTGTSYVMEKSKSGNTPHYEGTDMVYVGMMKNGEPCGFGMLDFQDGGTFYGEFLDGTVKGKGVYVYREADPTTEVTGSDWSMVSRASSSLGGRWYSGLVSGKTWQGYGMLCYNYSYYIGEVKDNYCHGHGTYWKWSQSGDPSGTLSRKDYGHYRKGEMKYTCSHDSKQTVCGAAISTAAPSTSTSGSSSSSGSSVKPSAPSSSSGGGSAPTTKICSKCSGSGTCTFCYGSGQRACTSTRCSGGICTKCGGSGSYFLAGKLKPCYCTSGRCNICYGKGYLDCGHCSGTGRCSLCGGMGIS